MGLFNFADTGEEDFSVIDYSRATDTLDTSENGGPSFWDNITGAIGTATGKITDTAVSSAQNSLSTRISNFFQTRSGTAPTSTGHAGMMPTSLKMGVVLVIVTALVYFFFFKKRR